MKRSFRGLFGVLVASATVATVAGQTTGAGVAPPWTRAAIEKVLPLLQSSAQTWNERRPCGSCHHHALGSMAIELAKERGFAVDDALLSAQVDRMRFRTRETALLDDAGINVQVSVSYLLIGTGAARVPANIVTDARFHVIAGKQQPDGHWFSESHRPPLEDSEFTATAVSVRALQLYPPPARASEAARRVARAKEWLIRARPQTTEERAMQLFGLAWSGAPARPIAVAAAALVAEQRPDGSWAQIPSRSGDAYATGQALVALNQAAGMSSADAVYKRGVRFLLDTQRDDGTWHVHTRRKFGGLPYFETGFPHGPDQFISYASSAWAVMALVLSNSGERSPILTATAPVPRAVEPFVAEDGVTPLMEAAAFGTTDDVRRLLDAGQDVNAASKRGLTALMASVRDPDIAALLLSRGAAIDARTADGYTPMMFAAGYDGAYPVLRSLLDRKAKDTPTKNGVTALMLAAKQGDAQKVRALVAYGADVNARARSDMTALFLAADQGDAAMVRLLVDAGADVNAKNAGVFGWTSLAAAASDGFPLVVRTLMGAHADLRARDEEGRSALDLARLVDNGPGTRDVIELLEKAGAGR